MNNLKIIVVDDDLDMRIMILDALNKFKMRLPYIQDEINFIIELAESGEEALKKIKAGKPDILICDYKLPDININDILEKMEEGEDSLTIMLSPLRNFEIIFEKNKNKVFDFIRIPINSEEIKSVISKAVYSLILSRQLKKISDERQHIRDQYVAVLTHELKSPLGAIESYLNLMNEKTLGNELDKYEQIIKKCISRSEYMRKLICDLLEMTKIESNKRVRDIKLLNLYDIARLSIENSLPDAGKNNIKINLESEPDVFINADKEEMEILFNNLITNALKYNNPNGKVDVAIIKQSDSIMITVKDTGIGLSEEDIKRLFKKFVRIKNKKTSGILGTGLGLSTVKTIVDLYGGKIYAEGRKSDSDNSFETASVVTTDTTCETGSTFVATLQLVS